MSARVHGHGHRVWNLHGGGLGLGLWWFRGPRVQRGAACGPGHRRTGSVELRARRAWDIPPSPSHPMPLRQLNPLPWGVRGAGTWRAGDRLLAASGNHKGQEQQGISSLFTTLVVG